MTSPNLAITHVAAAQNQKEVTVNDAIDALDRALTDALSIDFSGDAVTLTAAQFRQAIAFKPSAGLTANATLSVPQIKRVFVVINTDGFFTIDVVRGSKMACRQAMPFVSAPTAPRTASMPPAVAGAAVARSRTFPMRPRPIPASKVRR